MKALFPISLNNNFFNTDNVIEAYQAISLKYKSITFIIADQLQLYNKALQVSNEYSISDVLRDFREKTKYFEERKKWLEKLKDKLNNDIPLDWDIKSIDDVANDYTIFTIYRNILIAFYSDTIFANDIKHIAFNYANQKNSKYDFDRAQNLSVGYLLEEIAISIKLKVINEIFDEFYIGNYASPILKLFNNKYSFNVFDIAGKIKPRDFTGFNFYKYYFDNKQWQIIRDFE